MGTSKQQAATARDKALAEVAGHQEIVARWEAEKLAAEQELGSLQDRAGEEVLTDASAADKLSRSMQQLRDRIDIAGRAVAAATPRLEAASLAVLHAEPPSGTPRPGSDRPRSTRTSARSRASWSSCETSTGWSICPRTIRVCWTPCPTPLRRDRGPTSRHVGTISRRPWSRQS